MLGEIDSSRCSLDFIDTVRSCFPRPLTAQSSTLIAGSQSEFLPYGLRECASVRRMLAMLRERWTRASGETPAAAHALSENKSRSVIRDSRGVARNIARDIDRVHAPIDRDTIIRYHRGAVMLLIADRASCLPRLTLGRVASAMQSQLSSQRSRARIHDRAKIVITDVTCHFAKSFVWRSACEHRGGRKRARSPALAATRVSCSDINHIRGDRAGICRIGMVKCVSSPPRSLLSLNHSSPIREPLAHCLFLPASLRTTRKSRGRARFDSTIDAARRGEGKKGRGKRRERKRERERERERRGETERPTDNEVLHERERERKRERMADPSACGELNFRQ